MGIQQRLHKQRYSERNFRTPTKEDLSDSGLKKIRFKPVSSQTKQTIRYTLLNPPIHDRYFKTYIPLIQDFFDEVDKQPNSKVVAELYNQQLIRKLAYYIKYPQYYGYSFEHYSIAWLFNLLMSMRSYIMRQRIARNEMGLCWNKSLPSSAGYYKLPKPMGNKSMIAIGSILFDLCIDDTKLYLSKLDLS